MEGRGEALREDAGAFTWKEVILEHKGQLALSWELGMHGSGFHSPALYKPDLVGSAQEVEAVELGCSRSPSAS